jgi:hypothetical protein
LKLRVKEMQKAQNDGEKECGRGRGRQLWEQNHIRKRGEGKKRFFVPIYLPPSFEILKPV